MDKPGGGDGKNANATVVSDSEMPIFDLESQRLDFDSYIFSTSSDTDSSIYDCSLDESFQQIKSDLEKLHTSSPIKPGFRRKKVSSEPTVVDDDLPEFDINQRFDVMKDRIKNYRDRETETLRHYIIELNRSIDHMNVRKGKTSVWNLKTIENTTFFFCLVNVSIVYRFKTTLKKKKKIKLLIFINNNFFF